MPNKKVQQMILIGNIRKYTKIKDSITVFSLKGFVIVLSTTDSIYNIFQPGSPGGSPGVRKHSTSMI